MSDTAKAILEQALTLSPHDRATLADEILRSLHAPGSVVDESWAREAEARLAAYERGEATAMPMSEVLAKYRGS